MAPINTIFNEVFFYNSHTLWLNIVYWWQMSLLCCISIAVWQSVFMNGTLVNIEMQHRWAVYYYQTMYNHSIGSLTMLYVEKPGLKGIHLHSYSSYNLLTMWVILWAEFFPHKSRWPRKSFLNLFTFLELFSKKYGILHQRK